MVGNEIEVKCPIDILEKAKELAAKVKGRELPGDAEVPVYLGDGALSPIRHEFTTYESDLGELPLCAYANDPHSSEAEYCRSVFASLDDGEACPVRDEAYRAIKEAANDVAQGLVYRWRERHDPR